MKKIFLVFATAFTLFACNNETKNETSTDSTGVSSNTTAGKEEEPWVAVDSATAMKAMMEYGTPGPMHQMMASWSGTWTDEMTYWMSEGAPPMKSTGKSVATMLFGGRYQSSKHTGEWGGMPFEGVSTMGYDNAKKEFVSTWIDNMGTGIMYSSGPWNESSKTITSSGSMVDPTKPGRECKVRQVTRIIDENNHVMEMYGPDPKTGKEMKMMEIKSTRQK